jgi:putative transposase
MCHMRTRTALVKGHKQLWKITDLSQEATKRLKWFDYYEAHHGNARLTCRYFGISPQTFYRWKRRYDPRHLSSLEDRSHQPKRLRQPTWSRELAQSVLLLRQTHPRWGKDKLSQLLHEQGLSVSPSMTGRILRRLKENGSLIEPLPNYISARKRLRQRAYATRKPKDYQIKDIGDMVQLDTLDLRPLPGVLFKHFTAHDVVSKWNVVSVHSQATSTTAAHFLNTIQQRMPFPVKAIQVDGGPEFESAFEKECQIRGIRLFVLPPRSPKLNGGVERAHRTHTEEFYEVTDCTFDLAELREKLLEWERIYNTIRPHQALGYLTPLKFLQQQKKEEVRCH